MPSSICLTLLDMPTSMTKRRSSAGFLTEGKHFIAGRRLTPVMPHRQPAEAPFREITYFSRPSTNFLILPPYRADIDYLVRARRLINMFLSRYFNITLLFAKTIRHRFEPAIYIIPDFRASLYLCYIISQTYLPRLGALAFILARRHDSLFFHVVVLYRRPGARRQCRASPLAASVRPQHAPLNTMKATFIDIERDAFHGPPHGISAHFTVRYATEWTSMTLSRLLRPARRLPVCLFQLDGLRYRRRHF